MKWRVLMFLIVFAAGAVAGYFAAQKDVQLRAHTVLMSFGSAVEAKVDQVLHKVRARKSEPLRPTDEPMAAASEAPKILDAPEAAAEYLRNFVQVTEIEGKRDGTSAVVSGTVVNSGNQTLRKLEMSVYFMGPSDILHESRLPILSSSPLAPNSSKEFAWKIDAVPAEWTGRIRGAVTDISF